MNLDISDTFLKIGYQKYYVKGIDTQEIAEKLGKDVFGKEKFHDASYYADINTTTIPKNMQLSIKQFKKFKGNY